MNALAKVLAFAAMVAAAPSAENRGPSPFEVKLEMLGNSEIKATFTNKGNNRLKILRTGSILDTSSVEKAKVFSGETPVPFQGARLRLATNVLDDSDFQRISPGETVEVTFDIAETHDLSSGGKFDVLADGSFGFADEKSNILIGSIPYVSKHIGAEVDGTIAAAVHSAFHEKRTRVQSDCQGQQLQVTQTALRNCASIARKAQQAAASGPAAKLQEYFKSSSQQVRNTVSTVFGRVASECGSTNSGVSTYHCRDPYGNCGGRVLAYTIPSYSVMVYCPLYFNNLPDLSNTCHAQDKANTNLHESTHLTQIKGTDDYGGYGYDFVRSLTPAQNLNHADTYTLYAQAINVGC
ncbi:peptidase m35 deuterolysin protein [Purpureocillium lilacinum]|uniref:Neutral protease 2 n=1 Tax=Purpureocillium lilacinum TaxID=33203 RepID=A0A179GHM5_PURLI|nr:peptidase m35 deuterolysin protein [Purpureocillium lilacinum]OAQ76930.1 peptidase m35 deuterolysin protein [Purpureocillium lilacinum]